MDSHVTLMPTIPEALLAADDHTQTAVELVGLTSPPAVHRGVAEYLHQEAEDEVEDESDERTMAASRIAET